MKKYLIYGLICIGIYFLWEPVLGIIFPEYNYPAMSGTESIQAVADYLKENYQAEDFGIKTNGEAYEWKMNIIRERKPILDDLNFILRKPKPEPKRNRHLLVKVNYRKQGESSWIGTEIAKKKLVLNVDETDEKQVKVSEAE